MLWRSVAGKIYLRSCFLLRESRYVHFHTGFREYSIRSQNGTGCFHHSSLWCHPNYPSTKKTRTVLFSGPSGSKPMQERLHSPVSGARIRRLQRRLETLKQNEAPNNTGRPGGSTDVSPTHSKGQGVKQRRIFGRFSRIAAEKGVGFATYLYVLGESCTIFLTYCLHTNQLYVGEVGGWLSGIGLKSVVESYLEVGPVVFNTFRLSPRLLLNYLIANTLTLPLFSYQMAFCMVTASMLSKLMSPARSLLRRWKKSKAEAIPKAPSPLNHD